MIVDANMLTMIVDANMSVQRHRLCAYMRVSLRRVTGSPRVSQMIAMSIPHHMDVHVSFPSRCFECLSLRGHAELKPVITSHERPACEA
jgi:hypothetical protein